MSITPAARFPLLFLALSGALACGDCDPSATDAGVDDAGRDGGDPPHDAGPSDAGSDAGPGNLPPFTYATDCDVTDGEGTPAEIDLVPAFPGLTFVQPLFMTPAPGTGRLYVIEQRGIVWSFDPDDPVNTKEEFLDISSAVSSGGERGLLGIAFHPSFETNREFFVSYTERDDSTRLWSVIARYKASSATAADEDSEERLIRLAQPYDNHNGGMIAFGPDGYLYIGFGDGGSGGDPEEAGQDTSTLLGKLLRIDVDRADAPRAYGIPADNPFADGDGGEPEIFAWGLRNPWRWSFDRQTGDLWLADVGQDNWEEVNFVPASTLSAGTGVNFGWDVFEGFACFEPPPGAANCSGVTGTHFPELAYSHDEGGSITGGYVYRGSAMPSQVGRYFYGDHISRSVWSYDPLSGEGHGAPALTVPSGIPSFAEDEAGELYVLGYGGTIYRVVETAQAAPPPPPATLSATGCFTDLETLTPATGVLPYDVNMPLWSDGSEKQRWLVLPPGARIAFDEAGKWRFPTGTVLIKHFAMDTTRGDESTRVRLETRFLVVEPQGVRGFTYRWREDGSDADLLSASDTRTLSLTLDEGADPVSYTWTFPGPAQCLQCHTSASTGVLGLETAQLNREQAYGDVVANQIEALAAWSLLLAAPSRDIASLPRFPELHDESAAVGSRARAWLHANCANCHLPGGPTGRQLDLRYTTPLDEMRACDVPPEGSNYGIEGARLIKPGNPELSLLYYRDMNANARMPPLGTSLIPEEAGAVQHAWIEGLTDCTE